MGRAGQAFSFRHSPEVHNPTLQARGLRLGQMYLQMKSWKLPIRVIEPSFLQVAHLLSSCPKVPSDIEMEDSDSSAIALEVVLDLQLRLPSLRRLAIPAMSAGCERVFSSAKKLITPERNRLHEQFIEASERLKNWWDHGLIVQQPHVQGDHPEDEGSGLDDEDEDLLSAEIGTMQP
jgi:hypothetical protein